MFEIFAWEKSQVHDDRRVNISRIIKMLEKLIWEVKQLPVDSAEYHKALSKLLIPISKALLDLSPKFDIYGKRFSIHKEMFGFYKKLNSNVYLLQDLCSDASLKTIKKANKIVEEYNPHGGSSVINWFKTAFKYELSNCIRKQRKINRSEISGDCDNFPAATYEIEENCGSYLKVVREDPEGLLASIKLTYINQKTNVKESISLREILLMLKEGRTKNLMDIHRELNIPYKSLHSLIDRNLSPIKKTDTPGRRLRKQRIRDYFARYSH